MSDVHVFRPDHQLYCLDCGEGELFGNHGITAIDEGKQIYISPEVAEMYAEYEPPQEDELEDED